MSEVVDLDTTPTCLRSKSVKLDCRKTAKTRRPGLKRYILSYF